MEAIRIMPCLDMKGGRVVKGVHFVDIRDAGDPVENAAFYEKEGADELAMLDIAATLENRPTRLEWVRQVAAVIGIPLTVGGGINSVEDINKSDFSIAVPAGTTTEKIAKLMLPKAKLVIAGSTDGALDLLRKKKVKAMMADYPYTSVTSFKYQDKGFVANPPFSVEPIGIAIRPDDPLLTNFLENLLFLLKGDGMLDGASKRWFADPSWISELP